MISNGGDVCSVGWTIKGVHLQHLKVLHVHNLGCLVAAGRHKVRAVLAEAHVLDVCIVDPVLQQQFPGLQATTGDKPALLCMFQMTRVVAWTVCSHVPTHTCAACPNPGTAASGDSSGSCKAMCSAAARTTAGYVMTCSGCSSSWTCPAYCRLSSSRHSSCHLWIRWWQSGPVP